MKICDIIVQGHIRLYKDRHPTPADVALVVEVADVSLERDRGIKQQIYARAGIPVYWLINLQQNSIEVYTQPTGATDKPTYHQSQVYGPSDMIPVILDGQEVGRLAVSELLP